MAFPEASKALFCLSDPYGPILRKKGFTLLEVLLAIFIFGIVMTTIFGSFNAIFGNAEEIDRDTIRYEMIKTTLDRITEDLSAIYLTPETLFVPSDINSDREPDPYRVFGDIRTEGAPFAFLRFTADAHLVFSDSPRKGIARIFYYVQPMGSGHYVLKRSDALFPYGNMEEYDFEDNISDPVLCRNVLSFTAVYIDDEGTEYETWDSESDEFGYATPRAVKIRLKAGNAQRPVIGETLIFLPAFRKKAQT